MMSVDDEGKTARERVIEEATAAVRDILERAGADPRIVDLAEALATKTLDTAGLTDGVAAAIESADNATSEARQEAKKSEQAFMVLKGEYSELARILGFQGDAFWGDPLVDHAEIVAKAKGMVARAGS